MRATHTWKALFTVGNCRDLSGSWGIIASLKGIPTVVWKLFVHFLGSDHKWPDHLLSLTNNEMDLNEVWDGKWNVILGGCHRLTLMLPLHVVVVVQLRMQNGKCCWECWEIYEAQKRFRVRVQIKIILFIFTSWQIWIGSNCVIQFGLETPNNNWQPQLQAVPLLFIDYKNSCISQIHFLELLSSHVQNRVSYIKLSVGKVVKGGVQTEQSAYKYNSAHEQASCSDTEIPGFF